jgi:gluconolactonase
MNRSHWIVMGVCLLAGLDAGARAQRPFELKAESEDFWELIDRGAMLDKVAGGFGFLEGPAWHPRGFLYVSDETNNRISRVFPDGCIEKLLDIGDPDGSTLDRSYRLITTGDTERSVIAVEPDGTYRVLADRYEGKRLNSPNDVVLGPDGAFYFTDPNMDLPAGQKQEIPFQGVYRLGTDGSLRLLVKDLSAPNGLAFSPDGKHLYIDDSKTREIRVYDVGREGELSNPRLFGKEDGPPGSGVPDGMRVDQRGNLFVTGPFGIWVWAPNGKHLGTIVLPENAANLAWGDADLRTLYITATSSVYRLKTKTRGFVPYVD